MSIRSGLRSGIRSGLSSGLNPGISVDAASGKYVPRTASEWSALGLTAPNSLYLCQEASGNLADSIGGKTLTANAAPLYQQTVTGWSRKAVGFSEIANQRFQHTSFNDIATSSLLVLVYGFHTVNSAATLGSLCGGTSPSAPGLSQLATSTRIRYRNGATIVDSVNGYTAPTPIVFLHNVTGSVARVMTESEKLSPAFAAAAGTTVGIGGAGSGTSSRFQCLYMAVWSGAAAEMSDATIKTMLQILGWSPTWT